MHSPELPHPGFAPDSPRRQTRVALFAGFGGLLILLVILGLSSISFLSQIKTREEAIRGDYVNRDRVLQSLRSDIYLSGTHIRDFLLETSDGFAAVHRDRFLETERQAESEIARYRQLAGADNSAAVGQLTSELAQYMKALEPVLQWNAALRKERAYTFMQDELLPRRMSALSIADHVQQISERQLEQNSSDVSVMLSSFRVKLLLLLLLTAACGSALAGVSLWRLLGLEEEARRRLAEVVGTREELKRLSRELVSAQERERRRISRELHDEVGQVLSAIVFGLGNLRSALVSGNAAAALSQLQLVENMTQHNAGVVRNISLNLRPTMLDDLGLIPALKWLAREVSRTGPMTVEVRADSLSDDIPEEHRTCIFRVAQEALRNAVRHSGARHAVISAQDEGDLLRLSIQDDGKGFIPSHERGLGILGMEERVSGLSGTIKVNSAPGKGVLISVSLPLPASHRQPLDAAIESDIVQDMSPLRTA